MSKGWYKIGCVSDRSEVIEIDPHARGIVIGRAPEQIVTFLGSPALHLPFVPLLFNGKPVRMQLRHGRTYVLPECILTVPYLKIVGGLECNIFVWQDCGSTASLLGSDSLWHQQIRSHREKFPWSSRTGGRRK